MGLDVRKMRRRPAMTHEGRPSVPNGRPGGRFDFENMFVERPAGGAIEVLAGGFEGADSIRRGDSGDELLTPRARPENLRFGCHRQSGDAGFAILSNPPGMHGTGVNAEDKDPFGRSIRLRDDPNGLARGKAADRHDIHSLSQEHGRDAV